MKEALLSERGIYYRINSFHKFRPTLVFIYGLTGSASAWLEYEKKFEDQYNILTFDLRGHGKSTKPKRYNDYEIRDFVRDINDLIKHLCIKRFILVSHSFGTVIALELLIQHQNNVESAVFLSPIFNVKKVKWMRIIHLLLGGFARIIERIPFSAVKGAHIDYSKYKNTGDWNLRRIAADISNTSFHVYLYCLDHIYKFNSEHYLSQITVSVLIVHGKQDTIMPVKYVIKEAEKIKHCELILLDNANHIIVINNVAEVVQAIKNFVIKTSTL